MGKVIPRFEDGTPIDFKSTIQFGLIKGKQHQILKFLFKTALEQSGNSNRVAFRITTGVLAMVAETTEESAKKLTLELIKKGALARYSFVDGRGGWTDYAIATDLFQDMGISKAKGELFGAETGKEVGKFSPSTPAN